jgi:uncharacterized membrane protein
MSEVKPNPAAPDAKVNDPEQVWTYRGYKMKASEFNTAMVHFYRGEITRSNVWRTRLDNTTNWAVVTVGAILTFAFGSPENSHVVILISFLLVWLFLMIESRRYRYYELWALRVRLMESDFFAAMLMPPFAPHQEWAARMVDSLLTPEFPITYLEAFGRRLRRNYIWLFLILGVAWAFKLLLHPGPANSIDEFLDHAAVGFIPGPLIALLVACFFLVISLTAVLTVTLQASPGEVLPRSEVFALTGSFFQNIAQAATSILPDELPFLHQHEHLTIIITDKAQEVSQQLLAILKRGVTALEGKGMYTGKARSVLLCVVAPSQIDNLKSAVYAVDEHAFVVVNPTEEILGTGFSQLEPRWQRNKKPK